MELRTSTVRDTDVGRQIRRRWSRARQTDVWKHDVSNHHLSSQLLSVSLQSAVVRYCISLSLSLPTAFAFNGSAYFSSWQPSTLMRSGTVSFRPYLDYQPDRWSPHSQPQRQQQQPACPPLPTHRCSPPSPCGDPRSGTLCSGRCRRRGPPTPRSGNGSCTTTRSPTSPMSSAARHAGRPRRCTLCVRIASKVGQLLSLQHAGGPDELTRTRCRDPCVVEKGEQIESSQRIKFSCTDDPAWTLVRMYSHLPRHLGERQCAKKHQMYV